MVYVKSFVIGLGVQDMQFNSLHPAQFFMLFRHLQIFFFKIKFYENHNLSV